MLTTNTSEQVGDILRRWRKVRHLSQMELALAANVSTRHLSFVETGRARPGYDLLLRLAEVLQLPLRHSNALLVAGGFAPHYTDWSLDDDRTGMIRAALEHLLKQHNPYPAVVVDRNYEVVMHNAGFEAAVLWLTDDATTLHRYTNMFRLMFADDGLRPYITNWRALEHVLLKRLYDESIVYQSEALMALYRELAGENDLLQPPPLDDDPTGFDPQVPVVTVKLCKDDVHLALFSTMTTFGTAIDVTIQELRIESFFPADESTQAFFQQMG